KSAAADRWLSGGNTRSSSRKSAAYSHPDDGTNDGVGAWRGHQWRNHRCVYWHSIVGRGSAAGIRFRRDRVFRRILAKHWAGAGCLPDTISRLKHLRFDIMDRAGVDLVCDIDRGDIPRVVYTTL